MDLDGCNAMVSQVNGFAERCCLRRCDEMFSSSKRCTYVNEALHKHSYIDYMLTSCLDDVTEFDVLDPDVNYSDHLPPFARITNIMMDNKNSVSVCQMKRLTGKNTYVGSRQTL